MGIADDAIEVDQAAFDVAFEATWDEYSEDMKILVNYGKGFEDTDEDDCIRSLVTTAIETYLRALSAGSGD